MGAQGARGKATKATELNEEFTLQLVKTLEDVSGATCGVFSPQFGIFKVDAIQVPSIFGADGSRSPSKHSIIFPRRHPPLEAMKGGGPPKSPLLRKAVRAMLEQVGHAIPRSNSWKKSASHSRASSDSRSKSALVIPSSPGVLSDMAWIRALSWPGVMSSMEWAY